MLEELLGGVNVVEVRVAIQGQDPVLPRRSAVSQRS